MGKVMIHFSKDDLRYFAVLIAAEADEWAECGDKEMVNELSEMHAKILTCIVNENCEVVIDE